MARKAYSAAMRNFGGSKELASATAEHENFQAKAHAAHTGNFIGQAIKRPGALHRALGVPQGEKIPQAKIAKAANSKSPRLAHEARFAEELKGFNK